MAFSLDKHLGIYDDALLLRSKRTEVLAGNIANADTPGYKARDVDFKQLMQQVQGASEGSMQMATTQKGHFGMNNSGEPMATISDDMLMYRFPTSPSVDSNTVDIQVEKAEFAKNSMQYMADLRFVGGKFSALKAAIKGQSS